MTTQNIPPNPHHQSAPNSNKLTPTPKTPDPSCVQVTRFQLPVHTLIHIDLNISLCIPYDKDVIAM